MESKARIVRVCFIAIAICVLGLWHPALWMGLPLFFWAGCPCCGDCPFCNPSYTGRFQVDVSGMADGSGSGFCTGCEAWDGTYFLNRTSGGIGGCFWHYLPTIDIGPCFGFSGTVPKSIRVEANAVFGTYYTRVLLINCVGLGGGFTDGHCNFEKAHGAVAPDCGAFSSLNVPFVSNGGSCSGLGGSSACNGSAATVTVTAVA